MSTMAAKHGNPAHLLPPGFKRQVSLWLEEDCPGFDVGGFVVGDKPSEAKLLGKSPGMVAGVPFFDEVFKQLDCTVEWHVSEGTVFTPITHCATVRGSARQILLGERVALNTLSRCSGIATKTSHLRSLLPPSSPRPSLAGTRKTTPGFRLAEKYALLVGGADTHRHTLSTMTMLKDNHITSAGSITAAIAAARAAGGFSLKIEVETRNEAEAVEAAKAGADVVMLDNFSPKNIETVVASLKSLRPDVLVEISGGVDEANLAAFCVAGVDVISTSATHQGVKHVDFSLKIVKGAVG